MYDVCKILRLFLYIMGTSLPCYLFFILMYFILKKISPNGDISKRFYDNTGSHRETKLLHAVDNFMNLIYKNIMLYMINILFALVFILIIIETQSVPLINYIMSDAALRFQKYLIDALLTIIIAVIGSVAIFSSLNKDYYVFFTSKDIINIFKAKENIASTFLYYISCTLSVMVYYFCHYIIEDEEKRVLIKLFFFIFFSVFALITLYYIGKLLVSIMTFLLSDKAEHKSLNLLHKKIYNKCIPNLHIQKVSEMDSSIHYLLSNLNELKICNEKISFVSFLDDFEFFPCKIKHKNLCKTTGVCIIFNLISAIIIRVQFLRSTFDFIWTDLGTRIILSVTFAILFNAVVCYLLYKTPLSQIFIHLNMWTWGFRVEKESEKYYSSIYRNRITKKEYDNYFIKLYSILCAFKDILTTNEKNALYCLHKIISGINCGYGDYLLYIVSLFLYSEKYKLKGNELLALKQYIEENNIDWQLATHNLSAIIEDIERKNPEHEVYTFMEQVKNSKLKVKIKKV